MLLWFLFGGFMCKIADYIHIYFGTTLLYLVPVEWQVCLYNLHNSLVLRGPAAQ